MMDNYTLKHGSSICVHNETFVTPKSSQQMNYYSPKFYDPRNKVTDLSNQFMGQPLVVSDQSRLSVYNNHSAKFSVQAEARLCVSKAMRWWDKSLKPNMVEIHSAQQFVDALQTAANKLVIVDFYSPACGGCKSLHPKICQLAESNPDAMFLKVNYEELKPMCHALHIHVLPFFRFYRGSDGRVCSFSCTISTIKKFKDALAKYSTDRCSLGPTKGLDESELLKLQSIGELSMNSSKPSLIMEGIMLEEFDLRSVAMSNSSLLNMAEHNAMLVA